MRKTDYKNLDLFEASAVTFAAVGVLLLGVISYSSLDEGHQRMVASAFEMFDLHEQAVQQGHAMHAMIFKMPQAALDEFYLAFSDGMVLPDSAASWVETFAQQTQVAISDTLEFSDRVTIAFYRTVESNNRFLLPDPGRVAGAAIFTEDQSASDGAEESVLKNILPVAPPGFKPPSDPRSGGYTPPKLPEVQLQIFQIKY